MDKYTPKNANKRNPNIKLGPLTDEEMKQAGFNPHWRDNVTVKNGVLFHAPGIGKARGE